MIFRFFFCQLDFKSVCDSTSFFCSHEFLFYDFLNTDQCIFGIITLQQDECFTFLPFTFHLKLKITLYQFLQSYFTNLLFTKNVEPIIHDDHGDAFSLLILLIPINYLTLIHFFYVQFLIVLFINHTSFLYTKEPVYVFSSYSFPKESILQLQTTFVIRAPIQQII